MELVGARSTLVPVEPAHVADLRRILATPEVSARWGDEAASPGWPDDDPSAVRLAIVVGGVVRGMVQYGEEDEPMYRHASIDVFVDPAVHGCGIGRDAVATLAAHLVDDRGHHRIVIDPAADNEPAIRCYAAVGFRPVGVMRQYERDPATGEWHDGLLMDLLADELVRRPYYGAKVPDNEDYRDLARLLAEPSAWTSEEAEFMRSALADQRDAVEACHPKDVRRRAQMAAVADDIEAAVREYDSTR